MEGKKSRYTEAQNKATQKYQREKLEQINFRIRKGEKQKYIDAAAELGITLWDIKKLHGHNMYRMRVGNIRVLYIIDDVIKIISVEEIDNRGDVYKRL